ncbi:MAG: PKD domain-containing protein [Candidatus Bipolaricaulia bacterium]
MRRTSAKILLVSIGLLSLFVTTPHAQNNVTVQLVIIMDGSGSISNADFLTMINGIANAISDPAIVPQNGTVEFGLVQFSGNVTDQTTRIPGARVEVPMTVITAQSIGEITTNVKAIIKGGGFTPMVSGIRLAATLITGNKARPGARQVFNVISDGQPNLPSPPSEAVKQTLEARDEAVKAGLDQLDAEGIGTVEQEPEFKDFLLQLVWPQPGKIAPPFPPGHQNGFVIIVKTFADLENALRQKLVAAINEPPVADPGPIPDGKPDTEPYKCNTGQTITLDGSGSFDPDGQIKTYEWDFNGDGKPDATGPKVSFTCPTTPGSVTIKLTVTDSAGTTATAQQTITVTQAPPPPPPNQPPTAQCGTVPAEVLVGQTVQLDGSGSSDPEGKTLTYLWAFITKPTDSQATIADPTAAVTSFKVDKEGAYSVRLTVKDPEGASASCTVSVTAKKLTPGGRDELGAMKRDVIEHGRTLSLSQPLEDLRLALNLINSFGAHERVRQLISQTQETVNELLVSLADTRFLMESLAGRAEGVRFQVDAFVETNTISTERANRIHKTIDALIEFTENSGDQLDEIETLITDALELLAEAEASLSGLSSLAVEPSPIEAMSPAELIRSARDKLLTAFAQWRALLNGAITHIDKISSQMRAALKLAIRRNRFRLVKPQEFIELKAREQSVRFAPTELRWSVQNCHGCSLKVTVYGLDGRQITTQESAGPILTLQWARTPANGLYWYVLIITRPDGQQTRLLSKFVLVR